jgi:hypothetical protein
MTQAFEIAEIAFKSGEIDYIEAERRLFNCGYHGPAISEIIDGWREDMHLCGLPEKAV